MDCVYGDSDCNHSKCLDCGICTNGSQYHKGCFKVTIEDEEVEQLMACDEDMPTEEELDKVCPVRETTPLSAKEYFAELGYYSELGEAYAANYEKVEIDKDRLSAYDLQCIPETAFKDGVVSIYRYLNEECDLKMVSLMEKFFSQFVRIDVNCATEVYYDLEEKVLHHMWCIEDVQPTMTHAVLSIKNCDKSLFQELLLEHTDQFFCNTCKKFILHNGCENLNEQAFNFMIRKAAKYHDLISISYETSDNEVYKLSSLYDALSIPFTEFDE